MIINGDAQNLPIPDESIDIIFTSPPYNVDLEYNSYDDDLSDEDYEKFAWSWMSEAYRVLKFTGRMYIVISDSLLFFYKRISDAIEYLNFGQILTWCKPNLAGGTTKITGDWNRLTEHILLLRKGSKTPMLDGHTTTTHSYFVIASPQKNYKREIKIHPAQFPVMLPYRILSRTPGNVVLDPFSGSASVGVACKRLNRSFIGIELDHKYCIDANKRLHNLNKNQFDFQALRLDFMENESEE